jgi:5-methylcytosine-specific restriction protein B
LEEFDSDEFAGLIRCVQNLNKAITADESLGEGFCIGHSYFCGMNPDEVSKKEFKNKLEAIIEYEIIPMLKEYWFDEQMKIKEWTGNLRGSIK